MLTTALALSTGMLYIRLPKYRPIITVGVLGTVFACMYNDPNPYNIMWMSALMYTTVPIIGWPCAIGMGSMAMYKTWETLFLFEIVDTKMCFPRYSIWDAVTTHPKKLSKVLKREPNLNEVNGIGRTPIFEAIMYNPDLVPILIKEGAELNVYDKLNWTPLVIAIMCAPKLVPLLIDKGSPLRIPHDLNLRRIDDWSYVKIAESGGGRNDPRWEMLKNLNGPWINAVEQSSEYL